jgi:copper resistance protein C
MSTLTTPPRSFFARAVAAAATALLLSVGGLLVASPAHAHDELTGSNPAADSALDALPAELTLTFSGELSADPGATELQVTDAGGVSLAEGDPVIAGTVVTQPLSGAASGPITVLWKVVSSDGHPISGEFGFTITAAPTPTPTPTATPTATPSETATEEPLPAPTETTAPVDSGAATVPWILFAVLGVAVLGAITYLLVSRARRRKALEQSPTSGGAGAAASASSPSSPPPADR